MITLFTSLAALLLVGACGSDAPTRRGGRITLLEQSATDPAFEIDRATFADYYSRGPSWLVQQVAVRPVVVRDTFYGFRVLSLFHGVQGFVSEGIEVGDIVQQVNGMPIGRPDQFMKAWEAAAERDHLSIRVLRGGRPLLITWKIRDTAATAAATTSARP